MTIPLKWWEATTINGIKLTSVPAHHFSIRPPFHYAKDYMGFVESEKCVYFAGDSGLDGFFSEIGSKFDIDVALLPIAAYDPPSYRANHMSPEDALEAFVALRAKRMVPIHWGSFNLSHEPFDEPIARLKAESRKMGAEERVMIIPHCDSAYF